MADFGLATLVITRGADGAVALDREQGVLTVPGRSVAVVDTVGAGDTFTGGLLAALADGADLATALTWGVGASAIVVGRRGAQPPTRSELTGLLAG